MTSIVIVGIRALETALTKALTVYVGRTADAGPDT